MRNLIGHLHGRQQVSLQTNLFRFDLLCFFLFLMLPRAEREFDSTLTRTERKGVKKLFFNYVSILAKFITGLLRSFNCVIDWL